MEAAATWLLLRELRRNVTSAPNRLRALQDELALEAIAHAAAHVPFYRRYWREQGFDAASFRGLCDWHRIPVVPMAAAKQAARGGELLDVRVDTARCTYLDSSGSSGSATRIWKQPLEERVRRAGGLRIWFEHGFRWRDTTAQFQILPGPQLRLQKLGISRKTWISTAAPLAVQLRQFLAADADVVAGTPTALRAICAEIEREGLQAPPCRPRIVFGAGELMDQSTRSAVERVLGVVPIGLYGQTEVGYAAFQCEHREHFHWAADTHLLEVLQRGVPAPAGELGRLVVTDLRTRTMPFLRCDTGDLARSSPLDCPCGRTFPSLKALGGRARSAVNLPSGVVLTVSDIVEALTPAVALGGFRIAQQASGACVLTFLAGVPDRRRQAAMERFAALTAGTLPLSQNETPSWETDHTGKTHCVSSEVPLPDELAP